MSEELKCFRPPDVGDCRDACFYAKRCCFEENKPPPPGMEEKMPDKCECKAEICAYSGQPSCRYHTGLLTDAPHWACGTLVGEPCVKGKPVEDGERCPHGIIPGMKLDCIDCLKSQISSLEEKVEGLESDLEIAELGMKGNGMAFENARTRAEKAEAERDDLKYQLEEKTDYECEVCETALGVDDGVICQKCWLNDAREKGAKVLSRKSEKIETLQAQLKASNKRTQVVLAHSQEGWRKLREAQAQLARVVEALKRYAHTYPEDGTITGGPNFAQKALSSIPETGKDKVLMNKHDICPKCETPYDLAGPCDYCILEVKFKSLLEKAKP